jgi:hypothetical protein
MSHIFQHLDTVGDGSGSYEVTGNYASAAEEFFIAPPANKVYTIERMLVFVQDTGAFDAGDYGNGLALTNGLLLTVERDGVELLDLLGNEPIHNNAEWAAMCYDAQVLTWGTGDEMLVARWTFSKSGKPLTLHGKSSDRLVLTANDDMTGLNAHRFKVQGQSGSY